MWCARGNGIGRETSKPGARTRRGKKKRLASHPQAHGIVFRRRAGGMWARARTRDRGVSRRLGQQQCARVACAEKSVPGGCGAGRPGAVVPWALNEAHAACLCAPAARGHVRARSLCGAMRACRHRCLPTPCSPFPGASRPTPGDSVPLSAREHIDHRQAGWKQAGGCGGGAGREGGRDGLARCTLCDRQHAAAPIHAHT